METSAAKRHDELAARAKVGDHGALTELLARIDRLLGSVASRYNGVDFEDLHQEARMGAIRSLESWKPGAGSGFLTWCTLYVRGHLGRIVQVAARRRHTELLLESRDDENVEELEGTRLDDGPLAGDSGAGAEAMFDRIASREANQALNRLKWTESYVLRRRLAGDTLEDVGRGRGVTRERIRQLEPRLFDKLRRRMLVTRKVAHG